MRALIQKQVEFYDDRLTAARADDGHIYVSVAEVCAVLGLDRKAQQRRIRDHDVLGEGVASLVIETAGGPQAALMLRHDLVPLWLAGVQGRAVRDDVRPKLKVFQLRAADALDLTAVSPETAQALQLARAVLQLAQSQAAMEQRLQRFGGRLEGVEGRLETVEAALGDSGRYVTPDQASQISQAVKAVALALGKASGRNEYGGVYGEFYRRFGITGYKMLPARRFVEAMRWLTEWHETLTGSALPF